MLAASLLVLSLGAAAPMTAPVTDVPAKVHVGTRLAAPAWLLEGDQGIGRGVRNVLVGAGFAAVGLAVLAAAAVSFTFSFVATYLIVMFMPGLSNFLAPTVGTSGAVASVLLLLAGGAMLLGGGLWVLFNGTQVLMRLSPDYKPGPGTEYLDM